MARWYPARTHSDLRNAPPHTLSVTSWSSLLNECPNMASDLDYAGDGNLCWKRELRCELRGRRRRRGGLYGPIKLTPSPRKTRDIVVELALIEALVDRLEPIAGTRCSGKTITCNARMETLSHHTFFRGIPPQTNQFPWKHKHSISQPTPAAINRLPGVQYFSEKLVRIKNCLAPSPYRRTNLALLPEEGVIWQ